MNDFDHTYTVHCADLHWTFNNRDGANMFATHLWSYNQLVYIVREPK